MSHDLVELLMVAVCEVLAGADGFVEIEIWAEERLDWFRRKGGLEVRRLIAATSDAYRAQLLGLG